MCNIVSNGVPNEDLVILRSIIVEAIGCLIPEEIKEKANLCDFRLNSIEGAPIGSADVVRLENPNCYELTWNGSFAEKTNLPGSFKFRFPIKEVGGWNKRDLTIPEEREKTKVVLMGRIKDSLVPNLVPMPQVKRKNKKDETNR